MAQPDPTLAERVIASLADGTPLVTRKRLGSRAGRAVPRHRQCRMVDAAAVGPVRADAGTAGDLDPPGASPTAEDLAGTIWVADEVLDAFGAVVEARHDARRAGRSPGRGRAGPDLPPGLYAGEDRRIALNVIAPATPHSRRRPGPRASPSKGSRWCPSGRCSRAFCCRWPWRRFWSTSSPRSGSSGRLRGPRAGWRPHCSRAVASGPAGRGGRAQDDVAEDVFAIEATSERRAGACRDRRRATSTDMAEAGLRGLSEVLLPRTSIEPAEPIAVEPRDRRAVVLPVPLLAGDPGPAAALGRGLCNGSTATCAPAG